MTIAALAAATVLSFAQPVHNDTLRTNSWAIYLRGGISGYHNLEGPFDPVPHQYDRDKRYAAPIGDIGVYMYPRPWLRFGLNFGYTYLKGADPDILKDVTKIENVTREGITGTLTIQDLRIQNKNFTHLAYTDLTYGVNMAEIGRERSCQWFNFWVTVGGGYMHGWNRYTTTNAVNETIVDKGPTHYSIWEHSYVKSESNNNEFNAFFAPLGVSMEFDIIPSFTLGLYGTYKYFPVKPVHCPMGIWSAGITAAWNIGGSRFPVENVESLKNEIAIYEKDLEAIRQEKAQLESELANCATKKICEIEVPLSHYGVQVMAFRKYQHKIDAAIFNGDNPVIFRCGNLRRYVIFTDTLEAAQAKLKEVQKRYSDAFIVVVDDKNNVTRYE